ncbi:MAG: hypothetical protein ABI140_19735 [Jatrophihabitantaceae bacterium]
MTGSSGYALLPSGSSWLLLGTQDGWRTLANRTPPAVPTDGGLAIAGAGHTIAVAVGPYDRLLASPVLSSQAPAGDWTPVELPAGLADSRHALALDGTVVTAIVTGAGGRLLRRSGNGWVSLVTAIDLAPAGQLSLDSISWAAGGRGWLTGHGRSGTAVAFTSKDDGRTWMVVSDLPRDAVAALTPCGNSNGWQLPVLSSDGSVRVLRSADGATGWQLGAPIQTADQPSWTCADHTSWLLGVVSGANHLFISTDSGASWFDRGAVPSGLTDLSASSATNGFAAGQDGHSGLLWSVSIGGPGAKVGFSRLKLPSWIASLGRSHGSS